MSKSKNSKNQKKTMAGTAVRWDKDYVRSVAVPLSCLACRHLREHLADSDVVLVYDLARDTVRQLYPSAEATSQDELTLRVYSYNSSFEGVWALEVAMAAAKGHTSPPDASEN